MNKSRLLAAGLGMAIGVLLAACGSSSTAQLAATSGSSSGGTSSGGSTSTDERNCLWALDSNAVNTLLPDSNANYWLAVLPIPPGGSVELAGSFPHARYMSFNLYNELLQPTDALYDGAIDASAGSSNPFIMGADRAAARRAYSVKMVAAAAPADASQREPNTLYSAQTLGPAQVPLNVAVLVYRVYVPDVGTDPTGATGLPHIIFHNADGSSISGLPACQEPALLDAVLPNLASVPDLLADVPINTAAFKNLLWLKFFDLQSSEAGRVYNTPLGPAVYELVGSPTSGGGGFLSNQDNRYIYATVSQTLGNVVAIHAKMPTAPKTYGGEAKMGGGDMRYWSICSNDSNTLAVYACLFDEQIVQDAQGRGVILASKAVDRPSNAVPSCGVSWLDLGSSDTTLLLMRNMLPLSQTQFPYAIQYVPGPPGQHEAQVMGDYYPYGTHMMRADFEALGCPVSADRLPSVVTPPP